MKALAGFLILICLAGALLGLFLFAFRKGRRLRGLGLIVASFIAMIAVGVFMAEREGSPQEARRAPARVEVGAVPQHAQEPPLWQQAGFPNEAAFKDAQALGIERFGLYRLLDDREAIAAYCDWEAKGLKIISAADEKFGETPEGDQWLKKREWQNAQQEPLQAKLIEKLGVSDRDFSTLMTAGEWNWHCRAREKGLPVITRAMAATATSEDAGTARASLDAYYDWRLKEAPSSFFNPDLYSVGTCLAKKVDGIQVVGCQLRSMTRQTKFDYFAVSKDENGRLLAAPLFGSTMSHLEGVKTLTAYGQPGLFQAVFAYPGRDREKLDIAFGQ